MPYALQLMEGPTPGEILPILGHTLTLGRSVGDLLLEDTEVSGRHCSIQMVAGELILQDHGSRNGTLVNGEKTEKSKLRPGDLLKVGSSEFRIVDWPMAAEFLDPLKLVENWSLSLEENDRSVFSQNIAELLKHEWELCLKDVHLKFILMARDGRIVNHLVPVSELVVGRSGTVPLLAEDDEASRKHARFFIETDGKVKIEDLQSANGTFVNEERIAGIRTLYGTDIVRLGRTRMQVYPFVPEFTGQVLDSNV